MLENILYADSDREYYDYARNIYNNTSRDVLNALFIAIGLPISLNIISFATQVWLQPPRAEMDIKIEKRNIDSQISAKIASVFSSILGSARKGLKSGLATLKISLLVAGAFSFVLPQLLLMSRKSIYLKYPEISRIFQWLPSKDNGGLVSKILTVSGVVFLAATVFDYMKNIQLYSVPKKKPIFNDQLNQVVDHLVAGNLAAYYSHNKMPSLLLSGPPGTGKTTLAQWIAQESKMDYVAITGSDITQYIQSGMHVTKLNQLFQRIRDERSPTILFIDEAESLLKNRDHSDNIQYIELLHAFLKQMESENNAIMLILATNRFEDIDSAVLDRLDFKLTIPLPSYLERLAMIDNLISKHLDLRLQNFFSQSVKDMVAKVTEGFSGRRLEKMFLFLSNVQFESVEILQSIITGYSG